MTGLRPETPSVIGIDVGGTVIKGAVLGCDATPPTIRRWATPRDSGPGAVVESVLRAADQLLAEAPAAAAVGLVVPGLVDEAAGVAVYSENIEWHQVPFRALLQQRTGLPVGFGHDVRAGGLAERTFGAARGTDDVLFMPIGTGIAGAMYVQGSLVRSMYAGEIGHISVGADEPCACGAVGCLEAVASGAAIAKRYGRATGQPVEGSREVLERLQRGDRTAQVIWDEAVDAIARALATYVSLLAPERVVLGGGVSRAGARLFDPLRDRLRELLTWQHPPDLVAATLADNAGCLGAGLLARRELSDCHASSTASTHER